MRNRISSGNEAALGKLFESNPQWIDVQPAIEVIPSMKKNLILHAGPPIDWDRMCKAQRQAIIGAALFESLASDVNEALTLLDRGEISIGACHEHSTVGSMTGITSASMPVLIIRNESAGNLAYITLHEGSSASRLTYGFYSSEIHNNLKWIRDTLGPVLAEVVKRSGPVDIYPIISQALIMGDECHNRAAAGSAYFTRLILPYLLEMDLGKDTGKAIGNFLANNDAFFFHFCMGAAKASADAMTNTPNSSVVTAIARNGVEVGLRLAGTGDQWFTAPAPRIEGTYHPGYGPHDAEADLGDSAIMEVVGLGAFAMAASIPMAYAVGASAKDALQFQEEMYDITLAEHPAFKVPAIDFRGTPVGIDIREVVRLNRTPIIDTGIAGKEGGRIGVGISRVPMECFTKALEGLAQSARQ